MLVMMLLLDVLSQPVVSCGSKMNPCYTVPSPVPFTARSANEVNEGWVTVNAGPSRLLVECTNVSNQQECDSRANSATRLLVTLYGGFIVLILFVGWFLSRLDRIVAAWRRSEMPQLPWRFIFKTFWMMVAMVAGEIVAHGIFWASR